jgi:tetratricopeptide (TPR) repeat protein
MAAPSLSIKLRCTSWQQLATIYRRDLSRGSMFLKASSQPPLGTTVKIDLELPSATVLELLGSISEHVVDAQRGTGVQLTLEPLPTKTVWLIESALAAENKVRAATNPGARTQTTSDATPGDSSTSMVEGENIAEAEADLIRALESEAESLRKLNPFLVLGVGYETTDTDVRAAFGELTKRYHPDRFARYQSTKLRQIAAEIFILIRDAYRKLADANSRAQVRATTGAPRVTPPPMPVVRTQTPPGGVRAIGGRIPTGAISKIAVPPPRADRQEAKIEVVQPPPLPGNEPPTKPGPYDAPTNQSNQSAAIASTQLARAGDFAAGIPSPNLIDRKSGPVRSSPAVTTPMPPSERIPIIDSGPIRRPSTGPVPEMSDTSALEALLDEGKLDEALVGYRALIKKSPNDRGGRAGIELVEGLKSLGLRDRLEAAQRFESALEIDPSNERAARELADMRRQATNERKGLLSRLMGKKEGPP